MQIIKYMSSKILSMLNKINNLSNIKLFLYFFILIFLSRTLFLIFSLSQFPWFYEWEAMEYLSKIKNNEISIQNFYFLYEIKNQFQLLTKFLYLTLFKLNSYVWASKINTILIQFIPAIYMSIIIKNLFTKNFNSTLIFLFIILFAIFPGSLANFYHFSESHFYFHLLIAILSFEIYINFKNQVYKIFLISLLFVISAFNMEFVSLTTYATFATFFLYKFVEDKNKYHFYIFIILLFFCAVYYFGLFYFNIPSTIDASQLVQKQISRSIYLIFKGLFHQNSILLGLFILIALINIKFFIEKIKQHKNKDFIILLTIFFFIFLGSVAVSRIQIYDRYKDFIQLGGFISIFLLNIFFVQNDFVRKFLILIASLIIIYNGLFFVDKFYERRLETKNYDKILSNAISIYLSNNLITEKDLEKNSKKYIKQIIISVDNNLISIQ